MNTYTAMTLCQLRTSELRRDAARYHRGEAVARRRKAEQDQDSGRTATFRNLRRGSHRRLSSLTEGSS